MQFIDVNFDYRNHKQEFDTAIQSVIDRCAFINGPEIAALEKELERFVLAKDGVSVFQAITCASGTDALLLVLMALGVGPGDEVVTTPFSFIATCEVIALLGATPVLVDIDEATYNLDPNKLAQAIHPCTKAIIPVSLYGQLCNLHEICKIASSADHYIAVIEDAAQSFGANGPWGRSCGIAEFACTSFYPAKPLGCWGDGGAVFTRNKAMASKIRALRQHGETSKYNAEYIGITGRLDTIQAAVLLCKLRYFEKAAEDRHRIGSLLTELINSELSRRRSEDSAFASSGADIVPPLVIENHTHMYAQYTVRIRPSNLREPVRERLQSRHGIPTAVHYPKCLHMQPAYAKLCVDANGQKGQGIFPVSESAANEVVSLPMHPSLTEEDLVKIASSLVETLSLLSKSQ